jgi:DNA-binding XRE family transcriptional regulator
MKTNLIYGLRDPRNDVYYYIGKTTVGKDRPLKHLIKSHNTTVNDWVNQLESLGLVPSVDVIERDILLENLAEKEKFWIDYHYDLNPELFNIQSLPETINRIRTQDDDAKFNSLVNLVLDIGNILKTERMSRKLTQDELAEKAGLSRSTISLCEGGNNVTVEAVKKYLAALKGVDILTRNLDCIRVGKSHQKPIE